MVHGCVTHAWSPNVIDVIAYAGLDFIRIDNEHSWRQDQSAEQLIRAATAAGISTIFRVDRDNPYLIRKALEIGADAILVPDIEHVEQARAVVSAAKFPPVGRRGCSPSCFSGGWGTHPIAEWIEWSNREPMVGVMIEVPSIIEHVDEIMQIEGLDYVMFGPADFSINLGFKEPQPNHSDVQAALATTVAAAKKAGKHVLFPVGMDHEAIKKCKKMGVTMMEHSSDLGVLFSTWKKLLTDMD